MALMMIGLLPQDVETSIEALHRLRHAAAPAARAAELPVVRYHLLDLLRLIIPELPAHDTAFLHDYCAVLQRGDERAIHTVTCRVVQSIEDALRATAAGAPDALGGQRAVLGAWLSAAALAETPRAPRVRPALRQLLARSAPVEREALAAGWRRALPAGALLALSDCVRAPRPAGAADAPSLAELLLRAALCRLQPAGAPDRSRGGAPRLDDLDAVLTTWELRRRAAPADAERVALFGRVLAVAPAGERARPLRRLAAAKRAPRDDAPAAARADRRAGVGKLQVLFGDEDKILTPGKKRKRLGADARQRK
ncbi:uncharacterized protein LOC128199469 isoform X2 [Bicyclus anynana]|uniref:Uncharacterized protein LOC128199469 isoform X2 n=1 Tax=Bicyclus anynana TaxID=110368 RepID=A0ABM3M1E8_BICAN|nr:uncharacterized protein LOC128199469 isoform X2 [Bicyclus anynana]